MEHQYSGARTKQQETTGQMSCSDYVKYVDCFPICSLILTRVIGYGGLERNFIGNRPCMNINVTSILNMETTPALKI